MNIRGSFLGIAIVLAAACGGGETGGGEGGGTVSSSSAASAGGTSGEGGAGGAGGGQGGSGGSAAMPVDGESRTIRSCAPDDGPALSVEIGLASKTCGSPAGGPLLRIIFYTHIDNPAGNVFDLAPSAGEAQAIYNPGGDPSNIIGSASGALSVDTWDMAAAKGSYDVVMNDGTHLAGTFDAIACLMDQPMCG